MLRIALDLTPCPDLFKNSIDISVYFIITKGFLLTNKSHIIPLNLVLNKKAKQLPLPS